MVRLLAATVSAVEFLTTDVTFDSPEHLPSWVHRKTIKSELGGLLCLQMKCIGCPRFDWDIHGNYN